MGISAFETFEVSRLLLVVLLHFVWQATLVCLVVAIARSLLHPKHFQLRYLTSVLGLVLIVVCTLITAGYYCLNESAMASLVPSDASATLRTSEAHLDQSILLELESRFLSIFGWFDSNRAVWLGCWAIGFLVLVGRLSWSLVYCIQLRRSRTKLPAHLQTLADAICKKLNITRNVVVASSRKVSQAVATGIIKPVVLIPASWVTELPVSAIEAVLAHELAHVKRWDLWINMLQRTAETVFFFHPLVWWLSKSISTEREICCDKLAIRATGNAMQYVETLAAIANKSSNQDFKLQFGTAFNGGKNMKLLRRAKMILEPGAIDAGSPFRALSLITCVGLLVSFGSYAYCGFPEPLAAAQQDDDQGIEVAVVPIELEVRDAIQDKEKNKQTHDFHISLSAKGEMDNREIARQLRELADQLEAGKQQTLSNRIRQKYQRHADEYRELKDSARQQSGEYRLRLTPSQAMQRDDYTERSRRTKLQADVVMDKWREQADLAVQNGDLEAARRWINQEQQKRAVQKDLTELRALERELKDANKARNLQKLQELEHAIHATELRAVVNQEYLDLQEVELQKQRAENEQLQEEHLRVQLEADKQAANAEHLRVQLETDRRSAELKKRHRDSLLHKRDNELLRVELMHEDAKKLPGETSQDGINAAIQGLRNEIEMLRHELQQLKADRKDSDTSNRKLRQTLEVPSRERIRLDLKLEDDQTNSTVPILDDIPFVGRLFQKDSPDSD